MLQTVRTDKVDEKNEVVFLASMLFSCVIILNLSKKVYYLQFCVDVNDKSKSVIAIYIYASERSRHALSENSVFYHAD